MRKRVLFAVVVLVPVLFGCSNRGSDAAATGPYSCNDKQFVADQIEFAQGSISADRFVDVCGRVTSVRAARSSRSGRHGYFYLAIPGSSSPRGIEVVANLDAMARARSGDPPAWPWVAPGEYVYVQGRYYYDSSRRQGIDWTEDDTSNSWPHAGYVAVCNASGGNCTLYQ